MYRIAPFLVCLFSICSVSSMGSGNSFTLESDYYNCDLVIPRSVTNVFNDHQAVEYWTQCGDQTGSRFTEIYSYINGEEGRDRAEKAWNHLRKIGGSEWEHMYPVLYGREAPYMGNQQHYDREHFEVVRDLELTLKEAADFRHRRIIRFGHLLLEVDRTLVGDLVDPDIVQYWQEHEGSKLKDAFKEYQSRVIEGQTQREQEESLWQYVLRESSNLSIDDRDATAFCLLHTGCSVVIPSLIEEARRNSRE